MANLRVYLLIATLVVAGLFLLFLDRAEYGAADAFKGAVECADTSSDHCFQLYPGTIESVRKAQTSSGEQDAVDLATRNRVIHVSLIPSSSDSVLITAGSPVTVEWYVGSVVAVRIQGRSIPSTANLAAGHANVGFIGAVLLWLGGLLLAILFVNSRAAADLERAKLALEEGPTPRLNESEVIYPRMREALLLPVGLAFVAFASAGPIVNPGTSRLAIAAVAVACAPLLLRLVLTLVNGRVVVDRRTIRHVDWLRRARSWPIAEVRSAAIGSVRWAGWDVPTISIVGMDRRDLFTLTSLDWSVAELSAACAAAGIPRREGHRPRLRAGPVAWGIAAATGLASFALLALAFLPGPPANT